MARDQGLLDLAQRTGAAFLRLYQWEPHCLSFGRHEPALQLYDRGRIEALGLDTVRRPTGGRAVWHARELTYAVAAPIAAFGGLREAYLAIHALLARAIASLGLAVTLAPRGGRTAPVTAGACFATPAGGEVMAGGRKVVGSAQRRQGDAFLQHGSILLGDDQHMVARVCRGTPPPSREDTLSRLLGRAVTFEEMARAIEREAGPSATVATAAEHAAVDAAARAHLALFSDASWTWGR